MSHITVCLEKLGELRCYGCWCSYHLVELKGTEPVLLSLAQTEKRPVPVCTVHRAYTLEHLQCVCALSISAKVCSICPTTKSCSALHLHFTHT